MPIVMQRAADHVLFKLYIGRMIIDMSETIGTRAENSQSVDAGPDRAAGWPDRCPLVIVGGPWCTSASRGSVVPRSQDLQQLGSCAITCSIVEVPKPQNCSRTVRAVRRGCEIAE